MDKLEEVVGRIGMEKQTPEDLSWLVGYCTTLRSRLKSMGDSALAEAKEAFESTEPFAVGRLYELSQRVAREHAAAEALAEAVKDVTGFTGTHAVKVASGDLVNVTDVSTVWLDRLRAALAAYRATVKP